MDQQLISLFTVLYKPIA